MNDRDLSPEDVFTFVFEEYFKDGVLEDDEKQKIYLLRTALGISGEEYMKIMNTVNERFQRGEIAFEDTSHEYNNLQIYKKILSKAFADSIITNEEEKIILKVADILMIPGSEHDACVEVLRGKLRKKEKKYQIDSLDTDFPVKDISIIKKDLPEITIEFDVELINRSFIERFMKKYEELDLFFVDDQVDEEPSMVFMDTSMQNKLLKIYFEEREKKRFFNFFPVNTRCFIISLKSNTNSETLYKFSSVDESGDYYMGIRTFLEGDFRKAISYLERALDEKVYIFNLQNIIGLCYKLRSNFEEALKCYQSELQRFPHNNRAISNIAIIYKQLAETNNSVHFFEKSLSLDPLDPNCLMSTIATYAHDHNKHINKILNFMFICSQLWKEVPAYNQLMVSLVKITGEKDLEKIIIDKNKELLPVIREFFWLRNLFITGFIELALKETEKFLLNYSSVYKGKLFFKSAFEIFIQNRIACLPNDLKKLAIPIIERLKG
ncbi:hypothetical protein KAJ27_21320 [bacterium]|nr:hypothetical protein [bacterium]